MTIQSLYRLYSKHYLVDTDTRNIRPNTLFFALKGANFNGNKFAEDALKKGALYSVIDDEIYNVNDNTILVDNVLETLQELANYHRKQLNIPIIGLTGSNGKTTTKELIREVLSKKYKTTATKGNLNNHIGVPLTLLSMTNNTEIGIIEMGANHHKEIALLSRIAEPDYGYITNFGKAHLEGFGSVEGVIEAKSELYDYLITNNKTAFVNPKDKIQLEKTINIERVFFESSIQLVNVNPYVNLYFKNKLIKTNLIGDYNFNNISAAITIGDFFKVSEEEIKNAIENYTPNNNRSQIIKQKTNEIILDAYNANPTSMKAALENFNLLTVNKKRKVVILGDMFELGKNTSKEHQNIVDLVETLMFDIAIFVGENFNKTKVNKSQKTLNFSELKKAIINLNISDSSILIKGSRGMALERVLHYI